MHTIDIETYKLIIGFNNWYTVDAANRLPEPTRTNELNMALQKYIRMGWRELSVSTAKSLGRELTTEELVRIFAAQFKRTSSMLTIEHAEKTALAMPEDVRNPFILKILRRYISLEKKQTAFDHNYQRCIRVARHLPNELIVRELHRIIKACNDFDLHTYAQSAANLLPEPKRTVELSHILEEEIKNGRLELAERAAKLLGRALTTNEYVRTFGAMQVILNTSGNIRTILTFAEPERTEMLLKIIDVSLKQHTWPGELCSIALYLKEPWKTRELKKLIRLLLKNGSVEKAASVANDIPDEKGRVALLEGIFKKAIAQGFVRPAQEIVAQLGRKMSAEEVASLRKTQVERTLLHEMKKLSQVTGIPITTVELVQVLRSEIELQKRTGGGTWLIEEVLEDLLGVKRLKS
jgi:hypothetical protein